MESQQGISEDRCAQGFSDVDPRRVASGVTGGLCQGWQNLAEWGTISQHSEKTLKMIPVVNPDVVDIYTS